MCSSDLSTLQSLRSAISTFSTSLASVNAQIDSAFESIVTSIQSQIESVVDEIAEEMLEHIGSTVEELQAAVQALSANALDYVTSSLSNTLLQPVLDTLSDTFLDIAPDQPLRGMVQSVFIDPLERTLKSAFEEIDRKSTRLNSSH
mgnify:CR=1 FL=1